MLTSTIWQLSRKQPSERREAQNDGLRHRARARWNAQRQSPQNGGACKGSTSRTWLPSRAGPRLALRRSPWFPHRPLRPSTCKMWDRRDAPSTWRVWARSRYTRGLVASGLEADTPGASEVSGVHSIHGLGLQPGRQSSSRRRAKFRYMMGPCEMECSTAISAEWRGVQRVDVSHVAAVASRAAACSAEKSLVSASASAPKHVQNVGSKRCPEHLARLGSKQIHPGPCCVWTRSRYTRGQRGIWRAQHTWAWSPARSSKLE